MADLFELRWERPAAVLLAALEAGGDLDSVLRRVAERGEGWVRDSATVLLLNSSVREDVLDGLRRGLRPSGRLVEEAREAVRAALGGVEPGGNR